MVDAPPRQPAFGEAIALVFRTAAKDARVARWYLDVPSEALRESYRYLDSL